MRGESQTGPDPHVNQMTGEPLAEHWWRLA